MWVVVGDNGASGDDGVFALASMLSGFLAVAVWRPANGLEFVGGFFFLSLASALCGSSRCPNPTD